MDTIVNVPPGMLAGIIAPDGQKHVSPEAQDILDRLKAHYQSIGKPSAAHNYHRHLKSFFAWAETRGHSIRSLPAEAVESFLRDLGAAGQKESTLYVMRTQLKSALRECHNSLGVDFAHLEYQTGKPREVRKAQKEREKVRRKEKKIQQTLAQAAAIQAAQASGMPVIPPPYVPPVSATPIPEVFTPEEPTMSTQSAPIPDGASTAGAAQNTQAPVVVVQMPNQNQRPTATIGGARGTTSTTGSTTTVGKGMTINSHTFTGPYVRVSRMADGTDPLTPPGTETYITTVPLTQLAPHGDVAAYLQSFIMPNLRLSPMVSQVHFVFHELNDRRQPTGRRDELVVSMPMSLSSTGAPAPSATTNTAAPAGFGGLTHTGGSYGTDRATDYLLRKLDDEAAAARKRADELQDKLRTEKDAQTTFLLMQQFQKEQDLRRELEERKLREIERQNVAQYAALQPVYTPPPVPVVTPEPVRIDSGAEMAKAFAESQAKMMEAMMNGIAATRNTPPPPPQKDAAEWLVPFLSQMNQQQQSQQQANQQMIVQIMQANQQFMQALLTRENPTEKLLFAQLQEVKAAANAPKGDEMEDFANKLQKMKMVSDMLGGGGGGSSIFSELLANAEAIGEGAAKIIAASSSSAKPTTTLSGMPSRPALVDKGPSQAQVQVQQQVPPPLPELVEKSLDAMTEAAKADAEQDIVAHTVDLIRGLLEGQEPFPRVGQRLLNALRDMEDPEEMFTFAKTVYTFAGRKTEKEIIRKVADSLVKWYEVIHEQVFGVRKALGGVPMVAEEATGDEGAEGTEDTAESDAHEAA